MKLLTKRILAAFKKQGDTSSKSSEDIKIIAKFFNPDGRETWYAIEYNPQTKMFYGFVSIFNDCRDEFGSFGLAELKKFRSPWLRLKIERDKLFETGEYTLKEIIYRIYGRRI